MDRREAMLKAVIADPDDDLVRLAFADCIEEDYGEAERAEFIRVQVELARRRPELPVLLPTELEFLEYKDSSLRSRRSKVELVEPRLARISCDWQDWMRDLKPGNRCEFSMSRGGEMFRAVVMLYDGPAERMTGRGQPRAYPTVEYCVELVEPTEAESQVMTLADRERALFIAHGQPWFASAPFVATLGNPDGSYVPAVRVNRGFVYSAYGPAADWLAHADAILASHPVREVTLTTMPEFESSSTDRRYPITRYSLRGRGPRIGYVVSDEDVAVSRLPRDRQVADFCLRHEWPRVKTWHLPPVVRVEGLQAVGRAAVNAATARALQRAGPILQRVIRQRVEDALNENCPGERPGHGRSEPW